MSGRVKAPGGKPLLSVAIIMSPLPGQGLTTVPSDDVMVAPDGTFEFRGIAAGRYQIRARAQTERDGAPLFAASRVIVRGDAIPGVDLVLAPGASVSGRVGAADQGQPPSLTGARISMTLTDGTAAADTDAVTLGPDGSFALRGLMPGRYGFRISGLGEGWALERVIYRGQDVTSGLDAESGQELRGLRLVVARKPSVR